MTREVLVAIHATAGIAGLVVGIALFRPPETRSDRRWLRMVYGGLLAVLAGSLLALIITDWPDLDAIPRIVFSGLAVLAGVMLYRLVLADRIAASGEPRWERPYVGHVYFTYVSLWVGFAIVPALRSGNPGLWIPIAVVGVLAVGTLLIHRYQRRIGIRDGQPTVGSQTGT